MLNFTAADRVGVVGGYIGGISALLNGLGGMAAPAAVCSESQPVNRYEMNMALSLAQKDGEIATLKADKAIYGYEKDVMGRKDAGLRQKWERFKEHA